MPTETTIFLPSPPRETIETVDGPMMYVDWLEREAKRINSVPGRTCRVVRGIQHGRNAVWDVGNQSPDCRGSL